MNQFTGKTLLLLMMTSACGAHLANDSQLDYTAADSRRTMMTFETVVEFELPESYSATADVSKLMTSRYAADARAQVDAQTAHLYSALTEHPRYVNNPGAPHNRPYIKYGLVERVKNTNTVLIHYRYQDVVVFKDKLIPDGGQRDITFLLPRNPATIYDAGFLKRGTINYCTHEHYQDKDDHWYFWNPFQDKCPYKNNLRQYAIGVTAHLKALPSKAKSFPEYDMLYQDKNLAITYLIGVDEDFGKRDYGRKSYEEALKQFKKLGFNAAEHVSKYRWKLARKTGDRTVTVDVALEDQETGNFMEIAAEGMRKSDVFIYNGHSGLGGYLSIDRFREEVSKRFQLPKTKYQIYFFNGCSTYSYYNYDFIDMKRTPAERQADPENLKDRSKYLDIVTNGIGAAFDLGNSSDMALIHAVIDGKRPSWQEIVKQMYDADPSLSALTMVNGDGDNPRTPGRSK